MGVGCCERQHNEINSNSAGFNGSDMKAIEDIYTLGAFPSETRTPKETGYTYKEILSILSSIMESMESGKSLTKRIELDWIIVKEILHERIAENPTKKYTINRDAFIQLWEIADEKR